MTTNPANLPTFLGTIETEGAVHGAFEVFKVADPTPEHLSDLIAAVVAAGHALEGNDDERAVFGVFPGLGRAAITDYGYDHARDVQPWSVAINHPAMGRDKAEVHVCETMEEILAVLATVSYG